MMEDFLDEQANQSANKVYKINIGDIIQVKKQAVTSKNGQKFNFYSASVPKKEHNGTISYYKKGLNFKSGVELENNTMIKIYGMYENVRSNKRDPYEPIWYLCITDFEVIENYQADDIIIPPTNDEDNYLIDF